MQNSFKYMVLIALLAFTAFAQNKQNSIPIDDNSDWWSIVRPDALQLDGVEEKPVETHRSNFEILGVLLDHDAAVSLAKQLGTTIAVTRGDAAGWRIQQCYVSRSGTSDRTYFVIESGEIESTFYFFRNTKDWNGSKYCKQSDAVSERMRTASGLSLGITRAEIESILGPPNLDHADRIAYVRSVRIKSSPAELAKARSRVPEMPETEFQQNFEYYDQSVYIEARFKNSIVVYLAISKSETY